MFEKNNRLSLTGAYKIAWNDQNQHIFTHYAQKCGVQYIARTAGQIYNNNLHGVIDRNSKLSRRYAQLDEPSSVPYKMLQPRTNKSS